MNIIQVHGARFRILVLLMLGFSVPAHALGAPKSDLWAIWNVADEQSQVQLDHGSWQNILNRYLDSAHPSGINRFDYGSITAADQLVLDEYISGLTVIDPRSMNRAEQRAYWINLYNALTVQLVIRNYPVSSIRKINGGLFNLGPWDDSIIVIQGHELSLNDIEHRILRPIWRDPRIHYAVNCASLGCPDLAAQAYTAANTEALLNASAQDYINHPRGVNFVNNKLQLSSIFDWYAVDFGDSQADLLEHLAGYAEAGLATRLRSYADRLSYHYDWSLNEP